MAKEKEGTNLLVEIMTLFNRKLLKISAARISALLEFSALLDFSALLHFFCSSCFSFLLAIFCCSFSSSSLKLRLLLLYFFMFFPRFPQ
ncbi:hypothetical protein M9H77_06248 [Catharanthus roseus]|uniref:Uncharacterized protein n=1 Tax=Catharanthus roseus TaxID=4058 RepID=A0ACC0BRY9_CATRO|nr:hypothetical protein M9H77_06248 [Catharanthus roseus]